MVTQLIEEEYQLKKEHQDNETEGINIHPTLHMFRSVEGSTLGESIFHKKYTLPNNNGSAFAYMTQCPRQRPLHIQDDIQMHTPAELVQQQPPSVPPLLRLSLYFPTLLATASRATPTLPSPPYQLAATPPQTTPPHTVLAGTLKDPALKVCCEMWPSKEPLKCGTKCGHPITGMRT